MRGRFITVEGGEGAGKSSNLDFIRGLLESAGKQVLFTREPGGTPEADQIRKLLLTGDPNKWTPITEILLMYASRAEHAERFILPHLEKGNWVISDRFADSTMAYQSYGHQQPKETVLGVHRAALGDFEPDLTLILDLPVEEGLKRASIRMEGQVDAEDRFEQMGLDFHTRLRRGFQEIAKENPHRCEILSAEGSKEAVFDRIWQVVSKRLGIDHG